MKIENQSMELAVCVQNIYHFWFLKKLYLVIFSVLQIQKIFPSFFLHPRTPQKFKENKTIFPEEHEEIMSKQNIIISTPSILPIFIGTLIRWDNEKEQRDGWKGIMGTFIFLNIKQ